MGSLLGGSAPPAPAPQPLPAVKDPVPLPDEAAIERTKRRKAAELQARSGRASTRLTSTTEQGSGGKEFSRKTLG